MKKKKLSILLKISIEGGICKHLDLFEKSVLGGTQHTHKAVAVISAL